MHAAVVLWLLVAVWFNCVGWVLTIANQLNHTGYWAATLIGVLLAWLAWRKKIRRYHTRIRWRRFCRPLPAVFLVVIISAFAGGCWNAPNNFDALTYRLPRMLDWLSNGGWYWIPTTNMRMNFSAVGWEWTAMPLLTLTGSDRSLFLINATGFALLPGLVYSILRRLGVPSKVAWHWMWLVPLCYGMVTQAGSIGNDLTGTICFLISLYFGLRFRQTGCPADAWLALLGAALMTGIKVSNLPLALPCVVAALPAWQCIKRNPVSTCGVLVIAVTVSAVPIMALNHYHTGSWNGDPQNRTQVQVKHPATALLGNFLLIGEQAIMPPLLPAAGKLNRVTMDQLPLPVEQLLSKEYPRFYFKKLNELPTEESAGLGLGITLPLVVGFVAAPFLFRAPRGRQRTDRCVRAVLLSGWLALGVAMAKLGSESAARLLLPYYPLVVVTLLRFSSHQQLLKLRGWRAFLVIMALSVLPPQILSASRPLWPARAVTQKMVAANPDSAMWQRMSKVYSVYTARNDCLAPIRNFLPVEARKIGLVAGGNDARYSLWRPFGQRTVVELGLEPGASPPSATALKWIVVKESEWPRISSTSIIDWAQENGFSIVATIPIEQLVGTGPENWILLRRFGE
jgi:uncharacterized membrane protein YiaA